MVTAEAESAERFGREKFSAGLPLDFFTFVVCGVNGFGDFAGWLRSIWRDAVAKANHAAKEERAQRSNLPEPLRSKDGTTIRQTIDLKAYFVKFVIR